MLLLWVDAVVQVSFGDMNSGWKMNGDTHRLSVCPLDPDPSTANLKMSKLYRGAFTVASGVKCDHDPTIVPVVKPGTVHLVPMESGDAFTVVK